MKYRDVWDVWYLVNKLNAQAHRGIVGRKFTDCGTSDVEAKAGQRCDELAKDSTAKLFLDEMRRFLPAKRRAEMDGTGYITRSWPPVVNPIKRGVLPIPTK